MNAIAHGDTMALSPSILSHEQAKRVLIETTVYSYWHADKDDVNVGSLFSDRFVSYAYTVVQDSVHANVGYGQMFTLTKEELAVLQDEIVASQRGSMISCPRIFTLDKHTANLSIGTNRHNSVEVF
ncbi:MAG TPA: hypothetical protein PKM88_04270 [bacterium]|mgnify:CR=1 FL=1|nr:hypothetical protein [bacterium]